MKQTPKYKLNLVEPSDTFSPDPLNANMTAVESALDTARAEAKAATDAVSKRVATLEARRIVWGTYTGDGENWRTIYLGFTPTLMLLRCLNRASPSVALAFKDHTYGPGDLTIVEGGFKVTINSTSFNHERLEYAYVAYV